MAKLNLKNWDCVEHILAPTALYDEFSFLKNELQAVEKQLVNPRVYKGGWKNRKARRK